MRILLLLLLLLGPLAGCAGWAEPTGALAGADMVSVMVFGHGFLDLGVSAVSGKDCSIVRLDRRQTYCAPAEGAEKPGPYCTRSLGTVDCWADPGLLPARQREVADGPGPTAEQLRYREARWPKSLTAF
jgi:hypothetical protein